MRRSPSPLRATSSPSAGIGAERTAELKGSAICSQYFNYGPGTRKLELVISDYAPTGTRLRTAFNGDLNSVAGELMPNF